MNALASVPWWTWTVLAATALLLLGDHLWTVARRARTHTVKPAELAAMRGLAARYPEAYAHLLAEATAATPSTDEDDAEEAA